MLEEQEGTKVEQSVCAGVVELTLTLSVCTLYFGIPHIVAVDGKAQGFIGPAQPISRIVDTD